MVSPVDSGHKGAPELLDELVASGRLQPEEAELLHREVLQAEKRGASRAGVLLSWTTAGIAAVLCCLQAPWVLALPKFDRLFKAMDLGELPRVTELLLSVPLWAYLAGSFLLVVAILAKELLIRSKAVTLVMNIGTIFALMAWTAFVKWALFAPMIDMMQKLGQESGAGP